MKKILVITLMLSSNVFAQPAKQSSPQSPTIQQQVWNITEIMYHDVVNPPAAARFYSYAVLTGYEILSRIDSSVAGFQKRFNGYPSAFVPVPDSIHTELAVLYGILETGKNIIPSGYLLEGIERQLVEGYIKTGLAENVVSSSIAFAKAVSKLLVQYSRSDGYFTLSTRKRYTPLSLNSSWKPTPPEYMAAIEPHWRTIRCFFLDSAQQFKPAQPTQFDESAGSAFMKLASEVYTTGKQLTEEQKLIANFWDCNPFAVQFQGHMSIGLKKISPGGHWMCITGIVSEQAKLDFRNTMLLHTVVALTLHDAFISCWDEKYRSQRIRPETAINRYIDSKWKPLLQTPPFPEYSSGHSVISTAAAEVLTYFLGDQFTFNDSTENYIGIPSRKFSSFYAAAAEARISRLYGGIHFRDAIENGEEEGRSLGKFVIQKLRLARW